MQREYFKRQPDRLQHQGKCSPANCKIQFSEAMDFYPVVGTHAEYDKVDANTYKKTGSHEYKID